MRTLISKIVLTGLLFAPVLSESATCNSDDFSGDWNLVWTAVNQKTGAGSEGRCAISFGPSGTNPNSCIDIINETSFNIDRYNYGAKKDNNGKCRLISWITLSDGRRVTLNGGVLSKDKQTVTGGNGSLRESKDGKLIDRGTYFMWR